MRKAMKAIGEVLSILVLVVALALLAFVLVGPRYGWSLHAVLSGSMEPALRVGGLIVTRPTPLEQVQVGDIVTFSMGDYLVTHRVVEIVHREGDPRPWFRTQGDANATPDPQLVSSDAARMPRTVAYIPYVGYAAKVVGDRRAFLVLLGVPGLGLVTLLTRELVRGIAEERGRRKARLTD